MRATTELPPSSELLEGFIGARSLSAPRAAEVRRVLGDLDEWLALDGLDGLTADMLSGFVDAKLAEGFRANTVRKWLVITRSFCTWAYEQGAMSADTLLAIRAVKPPAGSTRRVQPQPYRRKEIWKLRATLDERWPLLPADEARHYARKWAEGRTSYRRIRRHAIRLQLDAIIALAYELGLRRCEIARLEVEWMHPDNAYICAWGEAGAWRSEVREVYWTPRAHAAVAAWLDYRARLGIDHQAPWVALHAGTHVGEPMKRDAFEKLLSVYIGDGWTLKRLRDTCAVNWIKRGLPLEHLRQLLGLSTIEQTLPVAALVGGSLERRMESLTRAA